MIDIENKGAHFSSSKYHHSTGGYVDVRLIIEWDILYSLE